MEHYAMGGLKEVCAQQIADDAVSSAVDAFTKSLRWTDDMNGDRAATLALAAAIESRLTTLAQAVVYHADAVSLKVED